MRRFFTSFFRIISRVSFLAFALLLGLIFWYLPSLLNFDGLRPSLTELLESTFHCKVLVGDVTGQLIPTPGLVIGHVVFLEESAAPRLLASVSSIRLSLSRKTFEEGRLEVDSIRFIRPRFIVHRERGPSGEPRWALLTLPGSAHGSARINEWQIRNGSVEIWDQIQTPTSKWVSDHFNGSFQVPQQTGAIVGKAEQLGQDALLDVHYNGAAAFPVQGHFSDVDLSSLQFLTHTRLITLSGKGDLHIQARVQPTIAIHAELEQPTGVGHVTVSAESGAHGNWRWAALGKNSNLKGTSFQLPEWSAKGDSKGVAVDARATTKEGGLAQVSWNQPSDGKDTALDVNASAVTLRQVLEIFKLQSTSQTRAAGALNSRGYEPWIINQGSLKAVIHDGSSFEIKESSIDLAGMHLNLAGFFDLTRTNPQARVQGRLENILMTSTVESFFAPPSPITGTGAVNFSLTFPLSADWIKGLNGPLEIEVDHGVVRALKTIYRIFSVLNLGNYLRLRFPQVTAQGIVFEKLNGHLLFQNGALSSDDLFLKSLNMNVGMKGTLDIPKKRITAKLRLEMFRFLEDILKNVPITHWIFKKPNKIFLPLVVTVEGPWDDVDIY